MLIIKNKLTGETFDFWNKFQLAFFLIGQNLIETNHHDYYSRLSAHRIMKLAELNPWKLIEWAEEDPFYIEEEQEKKTKQPA